AQFTAAGRDGHPGLASVDPHGDVGAVDARPRRIGRYRRRCFPELPGLCEHADQCLIVVGVHGSMGWTGGGRAAIVTRALSHLGPERTRESAARFEADFVCNPTDL